MTDVIKPLRNTYQGKAYGSNVAYLLDLELDDGTKQVIPVYPIDYEIRRFRDFAFTKESLKSRAALEAFLDKEREAGRLRARSVVVLDVGPVRERLLREVGAEMPDATAVGPFTYHVIGRVRSAIDNRRMQRENKRRMSRAAERK